MTGCETSAGGHGTPLSQLRYVLSTMHSSTMQHRSMCMLCKLCMEIYRAQTVSILILSSILTEVSVLYILLRSGKDLSFASALASARLEWSSACMLFMLHGCGISALTASLTERCTPRRLRRGASACGRPSRRAW